MQAPNTGSDQAQDALIVGEKELADGIAGLGPTVGLDTEFMRVRTYHPIPALYQLADRTEVLLVDVQAKAATFAPLKALLLDPERTKVMHACSEDLEVIQVHLGLTPANLIDTQVAHAFLNPEYSVGYVGLVKHTLGVELTQHETRSNWLARPLSAAQLRYAREDAAHLVPIWERQQEALEKRGRLAWFREEMARLVQPPQGTPDTWYRSVKGIGRLDRQELATLRSLTRWRELEARRRDVPRAWVAADESLVALAKREELDAVDLAAVLPRRAATRYERQAHRRPSRGPGRSGSARPPARAARQQRQDGRQGDAAHCGQGCRQARPGAGAAGPSPRRGSAWPTLSRPSNRPGHFRGVASRSAGRRVRPSAAEALLSDTDRAAGTRPEASESRFWERKTLSELTEAEWESVCDGCARCCAIKLEDEDTGEIATTSVVCRLLDLATCRCTRYAARHRLVPDCVRLDAESATRLKWLPETCGYRRLGEGRGLAWWHPLVSGDPATVVEAGVSVRGNAVSEREVHPLDIADHVAVRWVNAPPDGGVRRPDGDVRRPDGGVRRPDGGEQ